MKEQRYDSTSVRGIIRKGDLLLVEWLAAKEICFLPGGTVEHGEELSQALSRELAEEIDGATFSIGVYRGAIGHRWQQSDGYKSCLNHFYEVRWSGATELRAKEQGRCLRWITLRESSKERLQPPSLARLLLGSDDGVWEIVDQPDTVFSQQ